MLKETDILGKSEILEGGRLPPFVILTQTGVFLFWAQNIRRLVDALLNTRSLCITSPLKITRWRLAACAHFCSAVRPILFSPTVAKLNSICARLGPMILGLLISEAARASALPVRQKKRVELNITLGVVCDNEVWISPPLVETNIDDLGSLGCSWWYKTEKLGQFGNWHTLGVCIKKGGQICPQFSIFKLPLVSYPYCNRWIC